MSIELITGYAGEGHVSAADVGRFQAGVVGNERYILQTGTKFQYTLSGNTIQIGSGDAVNQGRHISIPQNSHESVSIPSCSQGKKRIDIICLKYEKNATTGVESASVAVISGTEAFSPNRPTVSHGNIFNGATVDYMELYYVYVDNTGPYFVATVSETVPSLADMLNKVYPVGAIYISTSNTNPYTLFGVGTWEQITGKFLLASSDNHSAGTTGGAESVTLTVGQLPSHTHTGPSHTHTGPAHTHSIAQHSHTATCASGGSHKHTVSRYKVAASGTARYAAQKDSASDGSHDTSSNGAHTHTITIASGGTTSTGSAGTGNTGAAGTGNTGATGSGNAVNIMPPFLSVYMWKRTA